MSLITNINGTNREITSLYVNVNGTNRKIISLYANVNGSNRLLFSDTYSQTPDPEEQNQ